MAVAYFVYADYASSGRSLQFLEDYINKEVLPAFGDISCISAVTGLQSHLYDNEARDLVRAAVGANAEDEIVFCDNPTERLCYLLSNPNVCDLSQPHTLQGLSAPPILFVSTSEPVSNLRSWIDAGWQIERIVKNHEGFLDLVDLEKRLQHYSEGRRKMVGLFSGASRLTGILADDVATTILLHQYDALSIWDHSMAASCAPICTNPVLPGAQKDAIFFHCNRLVGGVQAPGVLVIKRRFIEHSTSFLTDSVGVVSAVRAGLVLQLKESLGSQAIMGRMEKTCKQMLAHVRTIPEIVLLGPPCTTAKRLTTLCFMVRHPRGAFLHHRFVVAVLNDVFGIQATADNMISDSLGINPQLSVEYEKLLNDESLQSGCLHPGYTRITFPFFMPEAEVAFILEALKMVATEAWKLLPQYEMDERSGEWRHHSNSLAKERKWLGAIRYIDGKMLFSDRRISGPGSFPQNYSDCLQTARNLFNRARKMAQRSTTEQIVLKLTNAAMEKLRWYMLSGEAHELLLGHSHNVKNTVPFDPTRIPENSSLMLIHRHHSLSALDIKRFKSRSLPASPLQISTRRQNSSSPSPYQSHSPTPTSSPPMVRFSVGGEVTTMLNPTPLANVGVGSGPGPVGSNVVTAGAPSIRRDMNVSRNRCHSWGAASYRTAIGGLSSREGTPSDADNDGPVGANGGGGAGGNNLHALSPQTRASLGLEPHQHPLRAAYHTQLSSPGPSQHQRPPLHRPYSVAAVPSATPSGSAGTPGLRPKQRSCSCSSQTDLSLPRNESPPQTKRTAASPTPSLPNLRSLMGSSCSESTEDIQAYVKEVTKELATEIKSEIREVISKVEDVLESTDSIELNSLVNFNSLGQHSHPAPIENKRDSISTSDVVDYLREFSREMTNEVKSEIRDVVNAVDEIISPEGGGFLGARKNSPPDILRSNAANGGSGTTTGGHKLLVKQRYSDITPGAATHRPRSADNNDSKHRSESFPRPSSAASPEHIVGLGPPLHYTHAANAVAGAILKSADLRSTMSSQDSGINMSFCDATDEHSRLRTVRAPASDRIRTVSAEIDSSNKPSLPPRRLISEPTGGSIIEAASPITTDDASQTDPSGGGKGGLTRQQHVLNRSPSGEATGPAIAEGPIQWHQMPQEVWKQAAETLDEYRMLKDGDRVLVCISGSSSSLCLLHLLHQFCRTRQLQVQLAAITIGGSDGGVDPRALMLYLKELGVTFFYEPLASNDQLQDQLLQHARHRQYNVLAMASTLDKLADRFLTSLLYRGELTALQAVQGACGAKDTTTDDVRIVRPLLYLREHLFDEFALSQGFPSRSSSRGHDACPNGTQVSPIVELLRGQEKVNPHVYNNIRSALKPILSLRIEPSKSAYEMLRSSLNTRE
ncbi:AGAP003084-PA-like protein [Anopheles sinensis]|uniref:AGAP003084-PA-like protein n=1 Tax=Anopheles sinensis TaxID=74873 RepID=A0A084W906_ANOSI|nr:AGAP003084-PA-like protein [Anopheles sinensis]